MSETIFERVQAFLQDQAISFDVLRHKPVFTSAEAAEVRGTPLSSGAKALVCKVDREFKMFVLPADLKLASRQIRRAYRLKKLRFASGDEVLELTGLKPGSIPPFGSLFGLPTLCDRRLAENETINFNAGDHTISISMRYEEYLQAEKPELGDFGE